ncbi:MAG: D-2-hydroxyacid dehydrogenase [Ilumatobacteraceae bacterium]
MEEARAARRPRRSDRRGGEEGSEVLSLTLFCSATAAQRYGVDWLQVVPDLQVVTLPDEGRLDDDTLASIDLAVFSTDLWTSGRGRRFFGTALAAPRLRWLHMFSAGLDDPVFDQLARRGVRVTGSAGSSAVAIAHTVMLHALALCRNTGAHAADQAARRWAPVDHLDLEGRTMCVIGMGNIGSEVARLATAFGVRVIGVRRTPTGHEPCPTYSVDHLHRLLPEVDDLVLAAALNDDSRQLIGAAELALLRPGAHVINVGRGDLLDEPALVDTLRSGHLHGAALDVFATEPLPDDSPLWDMDNVLVTPHSAGRTPLSQDRAAAAFTDNLGRWVRGEPLRNEYGT